MDQEEPTDGPGQPAGDQSDYWSHRTGRQGPLSTAPNKTFIFCSNLCVVVVRRHYSPAAPRSHAAPPRHLLVTQFPLQLVIFLHHLQLFLNLSELFSKR